MTGSVLRVLLVDDEVLIAYEMAETLEELGFAVVGPCLRLEEAEKRAGADEIDVALLDVNLGRGKTSETVAAILRERGVPLVFMTAYDREQVAFVKDDDMLLRKPVIGAALGETLANRLATDR